MQKPAIAFLAALQRDEACLHPTDSLPGLAFNPTGEEGERKVAAFKGGRAGKSFLGLVASLAQAKIFWQSLPSPWPAILAELWPGPLTCVWQAAELAPKSLLLDQTVALRVPRYPSGHWMPEVLAALPYPLPSSSVNYSGAPPATTWDEAKKLLKGATGFHIPLTSEANPCGKPSTMIRIREDSRYELLREGAIAPALLDRIREKHLA